MRLEPVEAELLRSLLDQLESVLDDGEDDVRDRLNPRAYLDDDAAEAEYRTLTESGLRTERDERIAACRADLGAGGDVDLEGPDAGRRWIQVLNDLRLALGTRLGITEDDDPRIDPARADAQMRSVYYWLTAVQDSVVQGLMR
jgi:plasmid stability protein